MFEKRDRSTSLDWTQQLPEVARSHTQVAGVLAGFSITNVVLIASLILSRDSTLSAADALAVEYILGVFVVSFFGYIATGITYSQVSQPQSIQERFMFTVATIMYYMSVLLSFSGLLLLLQFLHSTSLILPVSFLISGAAVGGCLAVLETQRDLLGVSGMSAGLVFLLAASMIGAVFGISQSFPGLLDSEMKRMAALWASALAIVIFFLSVRASVFWNRTLGPARSKKLCAVCSLSLSWIGTVVVFFLTAISLGCFAWTA